MSDPGASDRHPARREIGVYRTLFHMPDDLAYFNTASMAPALHSVHEAGRLALDRVASPWEISSDDWFDDVEVLREGFAALVGADDDAIAFVPSCSYGLAVAARNLSARAGDRVLVLAEEFPSNFYTWRRFCIHTGAEIVEVHRDAELGWTASILAAIDRRTRVVAVPRVHWTNGALIDLHQVSAAARAVGAALVVDASQSLGAFPHDLRTIRPDFLVAVGYKWLLGPLGFSYLYVDEAHRDGEPLEENWINRAGSEQFAGLVRYTDTYRAGSRRFDFGERTAFAQVAMAVAAVEQLGRWGIEGVASALREVTDEICDRAGQLGLSVPAPNERGPHMLGLEIPKERGLALEEQLEKRGVMASVRGDSLRLAPHLHVTHRDIDRLIDGIAAAL